MTKLSSNNDSPAPRPAKTTPPLIITLGAVVVPAVVAAVVLWAPIQRAQLLVTVIVSITSAAAVWAKRRR